MLLNTLGPSFIETQDYMSSDTLVSNHRQGSEKEVIRFLRSATAATITPFIGGDCSVGMEYEMQVAVEGNHEDVDLALIIKNSNYFRNIYKRAQRGDLSSGVVDALKTFLFENESDIWENSWARLPADKLSEATRNLLASDLLADKNNPSAGMRKDASRFSCNHKGKEYLRLPISYLLKLALAEVISTGEMLPAGYAESGKALLDHLLSDNTSPEILSFTIPRAGEKGIGDLAAEETARTYLVCQLLVAYANTAFGLAESGQKCHLYFAPHAPIRQKLLNEIVPDGYYRHLFMSPCLSGWQKGEEKHHYMGICHKTLSRSQLNTIGKLKDAGILVNNLVTLPNTSDTCLANNGTHVSLGSKMLTDMANDETSGFTPEVEKYLGDLSIKIIEHFLPLFVGSYSAAPYRIDFRDFHPEKVLGFLPHELDFTHLRMVWRRWKKKAKIGFFGKSFTPFGPRWFDTIFARIFRLKGDLVDDYRLIDYLVTLLSTETCPGLDGMIHNQDRLKEELTEMGVFDSRMSFYLLYRQRTFLQSGYSGFEGRSYSLFHSLLEDMAEAVDMQNLITALAYRYILDEQVNHHNIPDIPSVESERRQIFFGSAIGIPTFYVRADTGNTFLKRILEQTPGIRRSGRYRGYLRVKNSDYRLALIKLIREDGGDLVARLKMKERLDTLEQRLLGDTPSSCTKLVEGISRKLPHRKKPLNVAAEQFNATAEQYFREELKSSHLQEGFEVLLQDCLSMAALGNIDFSFIAGLTSGQNVSDYILKCKESVISGTAEKETLQHLIHICLAVIHHQQQQD